MLCGDEEILFCPFWSMLILIEDSSAGMSALSFGMTLSGHIPVVSLIVLQSSGHRFDCSLQESSG